MENENNANIWKLVKGVKVGLMGGLVEHICGTFDLVVFKVTLESFNALPSICTTHLKRLVVE